MLQKLAINCEQLTLVQSDNSPIDIASYLSLLSNTTFIQ